MTNRIQQVRENIDAGVYEADCVVNATARAVMDDLAARGMVDVTTDKYMQPVLTEASRLRDLYRARIADIRASRTVACVAALGMGFLLGVLLGVWLKAAGMV